MLHQFYNRVPKHSLLRLRRRVVDRFRLRRLYRPRDRRGVSMLEMGLLLPVLITVVFGCIDFGRFAYTHIAVTNAARVGAGVASFNPVTPGTQPLWEAAIQQAIVAEMQGVFDLPDKDISKLTVLPPVISSDGGGLQRVQVVVIYQFETLVSWPFLPATTFPLQRGVEMRIIR